MPVIKSRFERLRILDKCLRSGWYSQKELKESVYRQSGEQVSQRTIQLDLDELKNASDPSPIESIQLGREKKFRYSDSNHSYFEPIVSNEDLINLGEAIAILRRHKIDVTSEIVKLHEKLDNRFFPNETHQSEYFQPARIPYVGDKHLLDALAAVRNKTVVKILYQTFYKPENETFMLHPHILKEFNGRWYLVGTDEIRCRIQHIALDRVIKMSGTDVEHNCLDIQDLVEKFSHIVGVTINEGAERQIIKFSCKQPRAGYIITKPIHHSQQVIDKNAERVTFTIDVIPNNELYARFLTFSSDLEVLEPQSVRQNLARLFREAAEVYKDIPFEN